MDLFTQQLINGLSLGAIYALIAVGYTMVYGVLRLINFAHGDVYMFGAMMGVYVAAGDFDSYGTLVAHPWFAVPTSLAGIVVFAIFIVLKLKGRAGPPWLQWVAKVLAAVAVSALVMEAAARLVRHVGIPSWISFAITMVAAMAVCGALGFVIELVAYRPLRNRPRIAALITAIGISMFLEYGGQGIFGATPKTFPHVVPIASVAVNVPAGQIAPNFRVGSITIAYVDVMIIVLTLAMMFVLRWIVMRTRTGMALRAVSYRFDTASLMGINIDRIVSFTFVLGSMLAGAAGVLIAARTPKVDPLMGLMPGIKAFVAAVLGGIGNIPGAVAGGIVLGLVEVMVAAYMPQGSQYKDAIAFVILIAILLVKPTGLFGRNLVEKV